MTLYFGVFAPELSDLWNDAMEPDFERRFLGLTGMYTAMGDVMVVLNDPIPRGCSLIELTKRIQDAEGDPALLSLKQIYKEAGNVQLYLDRS
jgi:hypothetical protein